MLPPNDPKRIDWQRYWVKHDGSMRVDDLGYLIPPTRDKRFDLQPDVFSYEEIASRPFLALMGETGSGKTDTMLQIAHALSATGVEVEYLDLGAVDTSEALRRQLERTKSLAAGGTDVTLIVDQYEESGLGEATYRHIAREIAEYPSSHLKVRLGCRSGSWTAEMHREFVKRWPDLFALEIGPLTRDDVLHALSTVSTKASTVLGVLEAHDLVPVLTRPVTLRLVMKMVERGEDVGAMTMSEVYSRGITEAVRPTPGRPHRLDGAERIAVARRLAAATVLCRRHTIGDGRQKAPRFGRAQRGHVSPAAGVVKALRASSATLRPFG